MRDGKGGRGSEKEGRRGACPTNKKSRYTGLKLGHLRNKKRDAFRLLRKVQPKVSENSMDTGIRPSSVTA